MYADNERYREYLKSDEWRRLAMKRMQIDDFTCQMCGCKGTTVNPLETHHLSYHHLYHEESRVYEDLITVCRCCHKQYHKAMERITSPTGRRGWKDNPRIPQIHVFNIDGQIEHRTGGINE